VLSGFLTANQIDIIQLRITMNLQLQSILPSSSLVIDEPSNPCQLSAGSKPPTGP